MRYRCEVIRSKVLPHGISHIIVYGPDGADIGTVRQYKRPRSNPPVYATAWDGAITETLADRVWRTATHGAKIFTMEVSA